MRSFLKWLVAVGLADWALSALTGHMPPRLRLLVLFSIAFGLLSGWVAGVLADGLGIRRSRLSAVLLSVLTVAGLANQTFTAYRQTQAAAQAIVDQDPQQTLALHVLEGAMADDPELQQRYQEERARLQPTLRDYLSSRLTQIGRPPSPWPEVIWGLEALAGGAAAALMFRRPVLEASRQTSLQESRIKSPKSEINGSEDIDTSET